MQVRGSRSPETTLYIALPQHSLKGVQLDNTTTFGFTFAIQSIVQLNNDNLKSLILYEIARFHLPFEFQCTVKNNDSQAIYFRKPQP